jgi:hypothetical protein
MASPPVIGMTRRAIVFAFEGQDAVNVELVDCH